MHPSAIERILVGLPGVRGVVVFGILAPEASRGQRLAAWLELDPSTSWPEIAAQAARQLPDWQCPRHWQVCERLPYNERGKISRRALAQAWPDLPRA